MRQLFAFLLLLLAETAFGAPEVEESLDSRFIGWVSMGAGGAYANNLPYGNISHYIGLHVGRGSDFSTFRITGSPFATSGKYTHLDSGILLGKMYNKGIWSFTLASGLSVVDFTGENKFQRQNTIGIPIELGILFGKSSLRYGIEFVSNLNTVAPLYGWRFLARIGALP